MDQTAPASAPAAAPQTAADPNLFELQGHDVTVTYSTSSITGEPLFDYKDRSREISRRGDEIRRVETEIGALVTITLQLTVDAGSTDFTVLIPRIKLPVSNEAQIATVGITTENRTAFLPLRSGQLQTYATVKLKGTARFVLF